MYTYTWYHLSEILVNIHMFLKPFPVISPIPGWWLPIYDGYLAKIVKVREPAIVGAAGGRPPTAFALFLTLRGRPRSPPRHTGGKGNVFVALPTSTGRFISCETDRQKDGCSCVYIYIHSCVYVYVYIYIYYMRERERDTHTHIKVLWECRIFWIPGNTPFVKDLNRIKPPP